MHQRKEKMLEEIQKKREIMIECARKNGFTSDVTVRCSQELDELMNEYHRSAQNSIVKERQMMMIWARELANI